MLCLRHLFTPVASGTDPHARPPEPAAEAPAGLDARSAEDAAVRRLTTGFLR